jgi:uncharacterized protein (UPF0264 family)
MAELLVSVRNAAEAEAALAGGAALIDVKEPTRGSLGRADPATIAAVIRQVNGRRPVSAALGEVIEEPTPYAGAGLAYAKWGLAGCGSLADWRLTLTTAASRLRQAAPGCGAVAVAYADWREANAPKPEDICAFAAEAHFGAFLVDTWDKKNRKTLLDWLTPAALAVFCDRCQAGDVRVALAGSLSPEQIRRLRDLQPDWFAVRGSVCRGDKRTSPIDRDRVRQLAAVTRIGSE